jgi:hypothetical protein
MQKYGRPHLIKNIFCVEERSCATHSTSFVTIKIHKGPSEEEDNSDDSTATEVRDDHTGIA